MPRSKHYHAMNGSIGCLPDHNEVHHTKQAAIDSLVSLFEGERGLATDLRYTGSHYFDDPGKADLVLELQLTAPNGPSQGSKQNGASDPLPMFRVVVYDRKTHYALWTLTESIAPAVLQKTHDHNFDYALTDILLDFENLTGKAPLH